ncbi:MAG TPA: RNA 2',3'-cyclic phosphodiesterase [Candidatus Angelobacter sp.]|nr:RNA 2',3'-cyclic phosphodiesterase [Candidatus Angelobacter sp.]
MCFRPKARPPGSRSSSPTGSPRCSATANSRSRWAATPEREPERWRVFLAIDLPDGLRANLKPPIEGLQPLHDWIRTNDVERIHLTLHFLGHLPVQTVEDLQPQIRPVVAAHRGFRLTAAGVGAFPNMGRAQVLWAGIGGADLAQLTGLQVGVSEVLRTAGIALEDRFHPHLTLARVRRPIRGPSRKLLADWHSRWREASFGEIDVTDVRLIRSQLGSGPARYTTVATFSLQ